MKRFVNCCIIFIICFTSCKDAQLHTDVLVRYVPVDKIETFELAALADSVSMIPLETTDDNLIKNIQEVFLVDSLIVVWDKSGYCLKVFDLQGQYKYDLGYRGNGSGRYISMDGVIYDRFKKCISFVDNRQMNLLSYDLSGNLLGQYRIKNYAYSFFPSVSGMWILNMQQTPTRCSLLLCDSVCDEIYKSFLPSDRDLILYDNTQNFVIQGRDEALFSYPHENILFKIKGDSLLPWLRFDFCDGEDHYYDVNSSHYQEVIRNEYIGRIQNLRLSRGTLYFEFQRCSGANAVKTFYAISNTEKTYVYDFPSIRHSSKVPVAPLPSIIGMSDDYVVFQINPGLISANGVGKLNRILGKTQEKELITQDSNPILVLYHLK